jgi:3-hydroxybutyryl-CoA dehydrogenase
VDIQESKLKQAKAGKGAEKAKTTLSLEEAAKDADLVIESIPENVAQKKELFARLDAICRQQTVFATTTCTLSITELATAVKRRDKFLGMHFFYPVPETKLAEIALGEDTSEETFAAVKQVAEKMGMACARLKESPVFIMNRTLVAVINEASYMLMEGLSTVEGIDNAMKLGTNWPKGPFEFADEMGLDTCLQYLELLQKEIGDPKYRPCPLLRKKVRAGYLGKKSGKGFYQYH